MGQEDPSFYPPQQTTAGDGSLADSYGGQGILAGGILAVCRGLKSESDAEIAEKGRF